MTLTQNGALSVCVLQLWNYSAECDEILRFGIYISCPILLFGNVGIL